MEVQRKKYFLKFNKTIFLVETSHFTQFFFVSLNNYIQRWSGAGTPEGLFILFSHLSLAYLDGLW
jgi:hypothetical protein